MPHPSAAGRVSVCLPARDEEATVGSIVAAIVAELVQRQGVVHEVVVLDDGSRDGTADAAARAGAVVARAASVLPECGPGSGKGEALWKALHVATGDVLVFCDADLRDFDPDFVTGLLRPLGPVSGVDGAGEADGGRGPEVGFVKGYYERPEGGGRVTELVARPLLDLFFPGLAHVRQPLGGEFAARREVLEQLPFVQGYGVDLGLLLDVAAAFGTGCIAQADLGTRNHRNRGLDELRPQATAVMQVALHRAGVEPASGWRHDLLAERPPMATVAAYREARAHRAARTSPTTSSTHASV